MKTNRYMLTYYTGRKAFETKLYADRFCADLADLMETIYYLIDVGELLLPTKLSVWDFELKRPVIFFNTN